ncbi:P-loop containing nucleoside triphosphate hydrolase protein [Marasmius fiardii PR-910]|nr:P-loop containing nucleoside triphosphate hydrolase protein [Marasmius fiardii PR-910]
MLALSYLRRACQIYKNLPTGTKSLSTTVINIPKADIYSFGAATSKTHPVFTNVEWKIEKGESWAVVGGNSGEKNMLFQTLLGHLRISPYPSEGLFPFLQSHQDPISAISIVSFTHRPRSGGDTGFYDYSARYGAVHEEDKITLRESLYASLGIVRDPFASTDSEQQLKLSEEDEVIFHELADKMGLTPFMDLPIIALSNGQTRRARILKAVVRKPRVELLLLDEPLTGLDIQTRPKLLSLLHKLHQSERPRVVLGLRSHDHIPEWVTNVAVVGNRKVHTGTREDYSKGLLVTDSQSYVTGHLDGQTQIHAKKKKLGEMVVDMKNVRVEYSGRQVLKDITWQIRQGERWHLQGTNGSGKTTLFSMLMGDHPQSYTQTPNCYLSSEVSASVAERHLHLFSKPRRLIPTPHLQCGSLIGVLSPEIFDAFPRRANMKVRDVVSTGFDGGYVPRGIVGVGLGVKGESKKYGPAEIREFVEGGPEEKWRLERMKHVLWGLGPRSWGREEDQQSFPQRAFVDLSVGEQRIVLLMRALVAQPKLVLLDEVWSGMDEEMVEAARSYLRGEGVGDDQAVVFITHWDGEVPWGDEDGVRRFRLHEGEGKEVA